MSVVVPGFRTAAGPGWRSGVSAAISVAVGRPRLWLFGALGFAARGGLVMLALPIVTIPSPVVLSTLFRDRLSTSGLAPGSEALVVAVLAALVGVLVLALLAVAYADVHAFQILVHDPDTDELRSDALAHGYDRRERLGLVLLLAAIQAAALVPALLIGLAVAGKVETVFLDEWILPSDFTTPFFVRVMQGLRDPLLALAAALIAADVLYALASRAVLVARSGLDPGERPGRRTPRTVTMGMLRVVTRPGRTLATAVLAWAATISILAPVVWAASVAWNGVRSLFLSGSWQADPDALPAVVTLTAIFAGIWVAATILAGFCSAVRAALWSADALR